MAEARDLMQNSPLVRGLIMELTTYAFGVIRYQARTGNPKLDSQYEEAWEGWCRRCDISGRHNFSSIVRLSFISMLRDGDCGLVKRMTAKDFKIQVIESDRIGRPQENWLTNKDDLESYFSGVIVNPQTGEPKAYRIFRRTREGMYVDPVDVPAAQFRHIFDPLRIDQYRGITVLDTAIPTCRDLNDILRYEKFAVKWNSSNTAIVERKGGEADEWSTTADGKGNHLEEINYGAINYVGDGETIKPFQTARPNASFEAFIEQLERQVCLSLQIPYGFFVNSRDSGGVTGRLESQKARRACARYQQLMSDIVLEPIKNDFLAWAIANNYIKATKNWKVGRWQFSAWPTADIGRESAANIEEHKLGLKTASDIYAEQGKDWEEEFEQIAREQVTLDRLSKEYGIPIERLSQRNPNPSMEPTESVAPAKGTPEPKKKTSSEGLSELWEKHVLEFNCGTGAGGFKSGNKCGGGGSGGTKKSGRMVVASVKKTNALKNAKLQTTGALAEAKAIEHVVAKKLGAKVMEMQPSLDKSGKPVWNPSDLHLTATISNKKTLILVEVKAIGIGGYEPKEMKATARKECRQRKASESKRLKAPLMTIVIDARKIGRRSGGGVSIKDSDPIIYIFKGVGSPRIRTQNDRNKLPRGAALARTSLKGIGKKVQDWHTLPSAGKDEANNRFQPPKK